MGAPDNGAPWVSDAAFMPANASFAADTYYCRYHPMELAVWMHPQTHECYCARCVERDEEADVPAATSLLGGDALLYLGSAGDAPAFWDQLAHYLGFPVRWQVLMWWLPVVLVGAFLVASEGATQWIGAGLTLLLMTQIAFGILTVTGDGQPLQRMKEAIFQVKPETLLALCAAQVIPVTALIGGLWFADGFVSQLAFVGALTIMPAMLLVALVEPFSGLASPQRWVDMINAVGWSYALIVGFLVLLTGVNGIAFSLFYGELPDSASKPLLLMVAAYSLVVFYRLMGGVVHQFQRRIGYFPHGKIQRKRSRTVTDRSDQTLDMLARDARFQDLEQFLRQLIKQRPQSQRYQELLGKLLQERGDAQALRQHADHLLDTVLKSEDAGRLLHVYQAQQALLSDYKPTAPSVRYALAQALAEKGEYEAAARLLINLHNEHPQYPSLGDAYWLLARLLAEELGQPEMAAQCAMFVYKTFPKHAERDAIEAFLKGWRQRASE